MPLTDRARRAVPTTCPVNIDADMSLMDAEELKAHLEALRAWKGVLEDERDELGLRLQKEVGRARLTGEYGIDRIAFVQLREDFHRKDAAVKAMNRRVNGGERIMGEHRRAAEQASHAEREKAFVDVCRQRLGRELYLSIWADANALLGVGR